MRNYYPLILRWHLKAEAGDYFSRFVFEYLAFIAHVKNNLFIHEANDRAAIQALKRDAVRKEIYCEAVKLNRSQAKLWRSVIVELKRNPLHNTSRDFDYPEIDVWWNSSDNRPDTDDRSQKGVVRSLSDWGNMIEFWYSVRNNLFHGGKDPDIRRDCFLVEHAYGTLRTFMCIELRLSPTIATR